MKNLKKISLTLLLGILAFFGFVGSVYGQTANFWSQNAPNSLVTNTSGGLATGDIHVAHCYIGLGTGSPCSGGGGGGGITTLNGDSTTIQTLTTSASGTNFTISNPGGGSHIFQLPVASAVNTGKLSNTDWSSFNGRLPESGGTMSGNINMGNNYITNLLDPVNPQDAATKEYVDSFINGLSWKTAVVAATTAQIATSTYNNGTAGVGATLTETATGTLPSIDGHSMLLGDRLLDKDESNQAWNGIYTVTSLGSSSTHFVLTRATDNNTSALMTSATVAVTNGIVNGNLAFTQTSVAPTMGSTPIIWVSFLSNTYTAGAGLSLTGNVFSLNTSHVNNWLATQIFDSGDFQLQGSVSGLLTMSAATTTTSYAIKWPAAQGGANTVLQNNGSGVLSWGTVTGAVTSVSNSDGTLTATPTTGAVGVSLNLANPNTWVGQQTFSTTSPIFSTLTTAGGVFYGDGAGLLHQTVTGTSGQFLMSNGGTPPTWTNIISGVSSVSNVDGSETISPVSGPVVSSINTGHQNTWTVPQIFNFQAAATSVHPSISLTNTTAALVGSKIQNSPALSFEGTGWTGSASQLIKLTETLEPTALINRFNYSWDGTIGASVTTGLMTLNQSGDLVAKRGISSTTGGVTASAGLFQSGGNAFDGLLRLAGSSTGNVDLTVPASITAYTLTLPPAQGGSNETLINNGSGILSWTALPTALTLQTNGTPNGSQSLLNLVSGTNITLTDNGSGSVTIDATGSSGANVFLSNLATTTAINSNLYPGLDNTIDIGTSTLRYKSLGLAAGGGSSGDGNLYFYDTLHTGKIYLRAIQSGTQQLLLGMGGNDDVLIEDNGGTPFLAAGVLANKKIGNIGGGVWELSGLEAISDGTSQPNLVLLGSATNSGSTQPQHYWQQQSIQTTDNTPTDLIDAVVAANSAIKVHYSVAAIRTAGSGSTGDTASWDETCTYKNIAGTATLVGTCHKTADKDNVALDIAPSISANIISLMATGATTTTYSWHVTNDTEFVN